MSGMQSDEGMDALALDAARRQRRMWQVVLAVISALLVVRAIIGTPVGTDKAAREMHGFGAVYVENDEKRFVETPKGWAPAAADQPAKIEWTVAKESSATAFVDATAKDPAQPAIALSWSRTIGVWAAAFFTLAVLSFLVRDNPAYKLTESVVVGVSAAYWMVTAFWDTLVPKLLGALMPHFTRTYFMPGIEEPGFWAMPLALVPLLLGMLLLCRLANKTSWLGIFPLAFIVGTFAGLKFVQFIEADLLAQVATMFDPLIVVKHQALPGVAITDAAAMAAAPIDWPGSIGASLSAITILVGVLTVLAYFFFSLEHKGALGRTARVGVWYLMITFGASFGFTVMGRIALLAARFEFLFDDWLWIIDPSGKH